MAIFPRGDDLAGLVHHSDRGVQYLSIRYSERLDEAGAVASVGSKGDSYDAMAESFNSLYKSELIHRKGPWRNVEHVEWATLNFVDCSTTGEFTSHSTTCRRSSSKLTTMARTSQRAWPFRNELLSTKPGANQLAVSFRG
jgi:putative transposase